MSATTEVKDLIRDLRQKGFRVNYDARHYQVYDGSGNTVVIAKTPSDTRWKRNVESQLKKLVPPPERKTFVSSNTAATGTTFKLVNAISGAAVPAEFTTQDLSKVTMIPASMIQPLMANLERRKIAHKTGRKETRNGRSLIVWGRGPDKVIRIISPPPIVDQSKVEEIVRKTSPIVQTQLQAAHLLANTPKLQRFFKHLSLAALEISRALDELST